MTMKTAKILVAALFLTAISGWAQTQNCGDPTASYTNCRNSQKITTSGNSITVNNYVGAVTSTFEVKIGGSPSTVTVTIQGCMQGGTCDTLDTYTTVADSIRKPTISTVYDKFVVTASWTGGSSPSVTVNTSATIARNGGGGNGSMTWPTSAGIAVYTGSNAWDSSIGWNGITQKATMNISGNADGNAATATALKNIPTTCSAGQAATGIDVNGNAQGCFAPVGTGNTTSSMTTAHIPVATGPSSLGDSSLQDNGTVVSTTESLQTSGSSTTGSGGNAGGAEDFTSNTVDPAAPPSNSVGWIAPLNSVFTSWRIRFFATAPVSPCLLHLGAVASAVSPLSCSPVVAADADNSIAKTGIDIDTGNRVTVTHLAAPLPTNQGGTGTSSSLVGIVRGGNPYTASELSGVVNTSGSNVTTPGKIDVTNSNAFCSDAGATDAYACNLSPAITAYVTGTHYRFKANTANTGAATVNFNSVGAVTIKKAAGGITTDLSDNDIRAGQWVELVYDGTNMQIESTLGNSASGGGYATVQDEGTPLAQRNAIDFIGAGVTCVDNSGSSRTECTIPGAAPTGYQTVQSNGTSQTQQTTVNFIGKAVSASNNAGTSATDVNIKALANLEARDTRYCLYASSTTLSCVGDSTANTGSAPTAQAATSTEMAYLKYTATGSNPNNLGLWSSNTVTFSNYNPVLIAKAGMLDTSGVQFAFIGWTDAGSAGAQLNAASCTGGGTSAVNCPTQNYAGFGAVIGTNTTWQCMHDNATANTNDTADSGVTIDGSIHRFRVEIDEANSKVLYYIDANQVCASIAVTHMPTNNVKQQPMLADQARNTGTAVSFAVQGYNTSAAPLH